MFGKYINIPAWTNVKNEFKMYLASYGRHIVYTFKYYYFKLNLFEEDDYLDKF
jgi:hypothetical protein